MIPGDFRVPPGLIENLRRDPLFCATAPQPEPTDEEAPPTERCPVPEFR